MSDNDDPDEISGNNTTDMDAEQEETYRLQPTPDVRERTQRLDPGRVVADKAPQYGAVLDPVMERDRSTRLARSQVASDGETLWMPASPDNTYMYGHGNSTLAVRDRAQGELRRASARHASTKGELRDKANRPVMRVGAIIMLLLAMGYAFPRINMALQMMAINYEYPGSLDLVQYHPQDVLEVMWSLEEPEMEWDPDMIRPQDAVDVGVEQNPGVFHRDDDSGVEEEWPPASLLEIDVQCLTSSSTCSLDEDTVTDGNCSSSGYRSGSSSSGSNNSDGSLGVATQQTSGSSSSDATVPVQPNADEGSNVNSSGAAIEEVARGDNGKGAMEAHNDPGESSPEVDGNGDDWYGGNHGDDRYGGNHGDSGGATRPPLPAVTG